MRKEKDWHETQEIKWYIKKEGLGKETFNKRGRRRGEVENEMRKGRWMSNRVKSFGGPK